MAIFFSYTANNFKTNIYFLGRDFFDVLHGFACENKNKFYNFCKFQYKFDVEQADNFLKWRACEVVRDFAKFNYFDFLVYANCLKVLSYEEDLKNYFELNKINEDEIKQAFLKFNAFCND